MPKQRWEQPGLAVTYFFSAFFTFVDALQVVLMQGAFVLRLMKDVWLFGISDPTQKVKNSLCSVKGLCGTQVRMTENGDWFGF